MQKTLAQLKRDLQIGTMLQVTAFEDNITKDIPDKMKMVRQVVDKTTTGVFVKDKNSNLTRSFLEYPKASGLVYEYDIFTVKYDDTKITYKILNKN